MNPSFVHLRVHSEYSLSDGMVRIQPLAEACVQAGMPAVALSDRNNLFALVKFYRACEAAGVKPLVAVDILLSPMAEGEAGRPMTLIAKDDTGYRNLCELISRASTEGQSAQAETVQRQWLKEKAEGLIALSGGREGELGAALLAGRRQEAQAQLSDWQALFPDAFYLEIQRTGRQDEEAYIEQAVALAQAAGCPLVATNDVRFLKAADFETHEAKVCILERRVLDDPRRERRCTQEQHLKSAEQMQALFADLPEALANTVEIAKRCNLSLNLGKHFLPKYPVPAGQTIEAFLDRAAKAGLDERLASLFGAGAPDLAERRKPYDERLAFELKVINKMNFAAYFLVVMEFIQWAKDNAIPVGPGRGSGAGSLVAYALKITDIDPLAYGLLFERFLNPGRRSLPDFDIDFCIEGRERVIQHVAERYGREAVSQIITFGTMAAKAVVRDVARVQGKPYGLADKLAKMIPFDPGITLEKALEEEPLLKEFVDSSVEAQEIMQMADRLEGFVRNIGRHAGGVVIAPSKLTDYVPVCRDRTGGGLMTQYDMNDVEAVGLVKFDFLGLKTLTVVNNTVQAVNARRQAAGEAPIAIEQIDLEDPAVYQDLQAAKTTAIFQLESRGMRDLMKKVKPSRFMDVVALVALYRPGPMDLADDFIKRKHGRARIDYLHPSLEPALADTYGIMLYQEQVMQIAQILAGFSLADADILRRAMGKKKPEEMAQQRAKFQKGAVEKGIPEKRAEHIFNLMEKFAGYGFNKPHSVAYALIAYQTAWLKRHYPADFMAASMSAEMHNTDKVLVNLEECRALGLAVRPPDVNQGEYRFVADGGQSIVYGLGAIKGLGAGAIECIVASRREGGAFADLYDFCERLDQRRVNRRALEALLGAGALDELAPAPEEASASAGKEQAIGYRRAFLLANLEDAVRLAEQKLRNKETGVSDLFGSDMRPHQAGSQAGGQAEGGPQPSRSACVKPLDMRECLMKEKESLGLYLTGHLIDGYRADLASLRPRPARLADLRPGREEQTLAGLIVGFRQMKTRKDEVIVYATLDDKTSRVEVSFYGKVLAGCRDRLHKDEVVIVTGIVETDDWEGEEGRVRVRARSLQTIAEARLGSLKRLNLNLAGHQLQADERLVERLQSQLGPHRKAGGCLVSVTCASDSAKGDILLGDEWRVSPTEELMNSLRDSFGRDRIQLHYG